MILLITILLISYLNIIDDRKNFIRCSVPLDEDLTILLLKFILALVFDVIKHINNDYKKCEYCDDCNNYFIDNNYHSCKLNINTDIDLNSKVPILNLDNKLIISQLRLLDYKNNILKRNYHVCYACYIKVDDDYE